MYRNGMTAEEKDTAIRALAAEKRLPETHLERWLAMDSDSRAALLDVARTLKFRTGQLTAAIDLLDEIAVRENSSAAKIFADSRARAIASGRGSAPERARAMLDYLRSRRFPELDRARAALDAELAALKLPRGVSMALPRELASAEVTVTLRFRTTGEYDRMLAHLNEAKQGIAAILAKLGGKE
jgi:hypothetical protein